MLAVGGTSCTSTAVFPARANFEFWGSGGVSTTRRSLKVGIFGTPDPNLLPAPSYLKNRHAFAVFCYFPGGPGPNQPDPPSYFMSSPRFLRPTCKSSPLPSVGEAFGGGGAPRGRRCAGRGPPAPAGPRPRRICPGDGAALGAANLTTGADFPAVDADEELLQLGRVREYLDNHTFEANQHLYEEAFEALQRLSELKAQDIFAFRETWTDLDTELLRGLDEGADGFVPGGELTTEAFAARLPSIEELKRVIRHGSRRWGKTGLAIVGGADSLTGRGFGQEIDSHAEVVRFNEIVGNKLVPEETGVRSSSGLFVMGLAAGARLAWPSLAGLTA
ncbi:unnamed protein product [Prorocentrum cordatum]|uniref:Uncharacterized protein n=1 Tax=Prorocentrum cordatum TaxID=2364126 RepID=A0ABN9SBA7_9DINO|nr:unnamed protein product [Polarella glacialis]